MDAPKLLTRRRHTNSKLGCLNCKRKKIRCDENLPQCGNCARAKRETCSYLLLARADINKIRLTHLLRNSQNKLLTSEYRLPTSTNNHGVAPAAKLLPPPAPESSLDVRLELCAFDNVFPTVSYHSLQFCNTFVLSYLSEYDPVFDDERSPSECGADHYPGALPHGQVLPRKFASLAPARRKFRLGARARSWSAQLLDTLELSPLANVCVLAYVTAGRALMVNVLQNRLAQSDAAHSRGFSAAAARLQACALVETGDLRTHIQHNMVGACQTKERNPAAYAAQMVALGHMLVCCFAAQMALRFPLRAILQTVKERCLVSTDLISHYEQHPTGDGSHLDVVRGLTNTFHRDAVLLHVPSYEPAFLYEVRANLRGMEPMFAHRLADAADAAHLAALHAQHFRIVAYLETQLLPMVYQMRNEQIVTIYPPEAMLHALQQWWLTVSTDVKPTPTDGFLRDLANTLALYTHAMAVALNAVMPTARYLFSLGFQDLSNAALVATPPVDEHYREVEPRVGHVLWRHQLYALRMHGYFTRRFQLFYDNVIWRFPFPQKVERSRFATRQIKNALEIPIRTFNTTPIKPAHYAKKIHSHFDSLLNDPSVSAIYTRRDDDEPRAMGEHFDMFDVSRELEFLVETQSYKQDYLPSSSRTTEQHPMDMETLRQCLVDRICLLEGIRYE